MLYIIFIVVTNVDNTFNYYTYDYQSFATALVNYDRKQSEITADTGRASYAIKLMDATGSILKSEERDLLNIRAQANS